MYNSIGSLLTRTISQSTELLILRRLENDFFQVRGKKLQRNKIQNRPGASVALIGITFACLTLCIVAVAYYDFVSVLHTNRELYYEHVAPAKIEIKRSDSISA